MFNILQQLEFFNHKGYYQTIVFTKKAIKINYYVDSDCLVRIALIHIDNDCVEILLKESYDGDEYIYISNKRKSLIRLKKYLQLRLKNMHRILAMVEDKNVI